MLKTPSHIEATLRELREITESVKDPVADDWDPMRLGLLVAKLEYEELDVEQQYKIFKAMAAEIQNDIAREASLKEQTEQLIRGFSEKLGFQGDKTNYYNIKNSFMNDVLLRRKGIPISLSLVFMALAREVGLKAVGISFPGHFLVKMVASLGHFEVSHTREEVEDWRKSWFIDAFDGGSLLTIEDCEKRLNEWTRGVVPFGPDVLQVAHPVEILSRMLRNLRAIFMEKEDLARLYWVLTALIELCPHDRVDAFRDRGLLFIRTGRFSSATSDFEKFLESSTDPQKRSHVERLLRFFENQSESLN